MCSSDLNILTTILTSVQQIQFFFFFLISDTETINTIHDLTHHTIQMALEFTFLNILRITIRPHILTEITWTPPIAPFLTLFFGKTRTNLNPYLGARTTRRQAPEKDQKKEGP